MLQRKVAGVKQQHARARAASIGAKAQAAGVYSFSRGRISGL
jgi:hypothetical protein